MIGLIYMYGSGEATVFSVYSVVGRERQRLDFLETPQVSPEPREKASFI